MTEKMQGVPSPVPERTVRLLGRKELLVEGVSDVVRFEEHNLLLDTELGMLEVDGEGLRIARLDPEKKEIFVCGTVNGLFYVGTPEKKSGGLFRRVLGG